MRGRISTSASSRIGRPSSSTREGDLGGVADAADALDLADVDAGDPHRRVLADVGGVLEHGLDLVLVAERELLGDGEVGADEDQRRSGSGRCGSGAAGGPCGRSARRSPWAWALGVGVGHHFFPSSSSSSSWSVAELRADLAPR